MKNTPSTAKVLWISAVTLPCLGVILRTVAMFVCFDREVGYFDPCLLTYLLSALSVVAVLLPTVMALLTPKDSLPNLWPEGKQDCSAFLPAVLCLAFAMISIGAINHYSSKVKLASVAALLALISALYYFLVALQPLGKRIKVTTLSAIGYAPILWSLIAMAETYTDPFTTMNSPIKLSLQFGFLGVMLATVSELRFRLSKPTPRAAICFNGIAIYFCLTGSIPTLIDLTVQLINRKLDAFHETMHMAYALVLLGVGIYTMVRLCAYMTTNPATEADPQEPPVSEELPEEVEYES